MTDYKEKRAYERHRYAAPITYTNGDGEDYRKGEMLNFSKGGLYFRSYSELEQGTKIQIRLEDLFSAASRPEYIPNYHAQVRSCRPIPEAKVPYYGIGVKFCPTPADNGLNQLREQVEKLIDGQPQHFKYLPEKVIQGMIHEVQVNQMQLELLNNINRKTQRDLEEIRNQFLEFYDFAPVGFVKLDRKGSIRDINFAGADILGRERHRLINKKFSPLIAVDFKNTFDSHCKQVLETQPNNLVY